MREIRCALSDVDSQNKPRQLMSIYISRNTALSCGKVFQPLLSGVYRCFLPSGRSSLLDNLAIGSPEIRSFRPNASCGLEISSLTAWAAISRPSTSQVVTV